MLLRPDLFRVSPFEDATPWVRDPAGLRARAAEQGFLFFPGLLPTRLIDPVRALVRDLCVGYGLVDPAPDNPPWLLATADARLERRCWDDARWTELQQIVNRDSGFRALAGCDPVCDVLEALFGEPAHVADTNICWLKLPGSPEQTTLPHQDLYYLRDSAAMRTVWFPAVDTPFDVGPLALVPGSHHRGLRPHVDAMTGIAVPPNVGWASSPVKPGDVVIFDALTVHAAWSNISPRSVRVSFDVRYLPRSLSAGCPLLSSEARSRRP
jgi:hypothetical protein